MGQFHTTGRPPVAASTTNRVAVPRWRGVLEALRQSTWARPIARGLSAIAIVSGLAWIGAQSATPMLPTDAASVIPGFAPNLSIAAPARRQPMATSANNVFDAGLAPSSKHDPPSEGVLPDGRVVLNKATEEDLCRLPSVGPKRAKSILALRVKLGGFQSVRSLLKVRGIGPRTLKRLAPLVVLDAPAAEGGGDGGVSKGDEERTVPSASPIATEDQHAK